MNKVCVLIPCLMRDNNRSANIKFISENIERMNADAYIIYTQCFNENDRITLSHPKTTFIGNATEPQGFVTPRNKLLEYFYESDFDYAVWIDANGSITSTTMNTYLTVLDAVKRGTVDVDAIFSSLGIITSSERMNLAAMDDYFDVAKLLPASRYSVKNCAWLHGCFMRNLNKYYGHKLFIDKTCDPWKGTSEDIFLSTLLRQCCSKCYLCPSITISKPSAKTSTWMNNSVDGKGKPSYGYPPVDWDTMYSMVKEHAIKVSDEDKSTNIIEIKRVDEYKNTLQPFRSRKKVAEVSSKINLF